MQAPSRLRLKESSAKHRKKLRAGASGAADDAPARDVPKGEWPLEWVTAEEWTNRERPTAAQINASDALALVRREHVRNVFKRAWRSYEKYAWGARGIVAEAPWGVAAPAATHRSTAQREARPRAWGLSRGL